MVKVNLLFKPKLTSHPRSGKLVRTRWANPPGGGAGKQRTSIIALNFTDHPGARDQTLAGSLPPMEHPDINDVFTGMQHSGYIVLVKFVISRKAPPGSKPHTSPIDMNPITGVSRDQKSSPSPFKLETPLKIYDSIHGNFFTWHPNPPCMAGERALPSRFTPQTGERSCDRSIGLHPVLRRKSPCRTIMFMDLHLASERQVSKLSKFACRDNSVGCFSTIFTHTSPENSWSSNIPNKSA